MLAQVRMGHAFSLTQLVGGADAPIVTCLETDLLLYIVRMLIRDEPVAIGQLICCCRTLSQLASTSTDAGNSEAGADLRKARRLVARQRIFDLRVLAGQQPAALVPLVTEISRPLTLTAMHPGIDEPCELDISRWYSSGRASHEDGQRGSAVKRVLYANESILSLDLSVCYLSYEDAVEIAKGLRVHRSLTTLNASGNFFGGFGRNNVFVKSPQGMDAIADALCVSRLKHLGLAENRLGPEGVSALMPGLATCSLTSLDLSRNGLGVEGATVLAAALATNSSLLQLDVRLNRLSPQGGQALAPGIVACRSLVSVDARFNGIAEGDEGEVALREAVSARFKQGAAQFELMVLNGL